MRQEQSPGSIPYRLEKRDLNKGTEASLEWPPYKVTWRATEVSSHTPFVFRNSSSSLPWEAYPGVQCALGRGYHRSVVMSRLILHFVILHLHLSCNLVCKTWFARIRLKEA